MEARDAESAPVWSGWVLPLLLGRSFTPWSAGAGSADSSNLPDSSLTHLTAWDECLYCSGPHCPLLPYLVLPGLPEISSICLFKVIKPSRRSISEEMLVVEFRGIIWVRLCKQRHWSQSLFVYVVVDFFFFTLFFNWRKVVLQCCVRFCLTTIRISHNYTHIPSLPSHHPSPLGHHRARS